MHKKNSAARLTKGGVMPQKFVVLDGATMQPLPREERRYGRLTLLLMGGLVIVWVILELDVI